MPSRIEIDQVIEVIADIVSDVNLDTVRVTRGSFGDILVEKNIAVDPRTINRLWTQFRASSCVRNINSDKSVLVIVDEVKSLKSAHTHSAHTHRRTLSEVA